MSLLRRTVSPPEGNVNLAFGGVTLPYNSRTMPRIEDLELLRTIGDPLADNSLDVLLRRSHSGDPASMAKGGCPAGNMVQALMARVGEITRLENPLQPGPEFSITDVLSKCTDEDDRAILAMWESVSTVPTWLDWELLERGQDASHRYAPLLLYILAMGSLATGYASSVIDQTLAATGYLSSSSRSSVMRRLAETGHMTVLMARGVKAMNVGGCGWKAVINVRYLHAMVRRRIMAKSPAFASQYGIPVNQTDMVSTLFAFTSSVVVHLETFGVPMSDEHSRGYLHLWAYAGHLLGVRTDLNYLIPVDALTQAIAAAKRAGSPAPGAITPNPILATDPLAFGHVLGTALREHLFFPSDMTKELTCRLLDGISDQFPFNIPLSRLQTVLYHLKHER
ncbi:hypothetical protein BC828DRAFT_155935 [Blastocladiella britannica]|nr:hypothetical protein BC828DRAFT_155935 [Blastocladiella britannica]